MMLDDMETVLSDIQEFITGERPIDSSDRILATVLFLDIASSTERAAELGDTPWRNLLNSVLRCRAKRIGALSREGNQHYGRQFSRDVRAQPGPNYCDPRLEGVRVNDGRYCIRGIVKPVYAFKTKRESEREDQEDRRTDGKLSKHVHG